MVAKKSKPDLAREGLKRVKNKLQKNAKTRTWPWTQAQLARVLGVTAQAVSQWPKVPAEHVQTIASELKMKPTDIRPDIFKKVTR